MPVLSSTLVLPNMKWLADAEEVEEAAYDCPLTESVEFDLDRHEATIRYSGAEALEQILYRLAHSGYPAANA